ncbi:hypothetical protein FOVSG1_014412 [Fusarium oxysporum f. sp. vasinfectum]
MSSVFAYLKNEQPELAKKQIALVSTDPFISRSDQRLNQRIGGTKVKHDHFGPELQAFQLSRVLSIRWRSPYTITILYLIYTFTSSPRQTTVLSKESGVSYTIAPDPRIPKYGSPKPIADHELSVATAIATASENILMLPPTTLASLADAV